MGGVANGVRLRAEVVDWGSPEWLVDRGPWDLLLGGRRPLRSVAMSPR